MVESEEEEEDYAIVFVRIVKETEDLKVLSSHLRMRAAAAAAVDNRIFVDCIVPCKRRVEHVLPELSLEIDSIGLSSVVGALD